MPASYGPLAPVIGYLLGSVAFSIVIVRLISGKDVRSVGSGNAGATNVLRAAGKWAALATIVGDVGKGVLAVVIARWLTGDPLWIAAAAAAAVLGHVFPVFFGFRGGKGVATAAGAFATLGWFPVVLVVPVFVILVASSKYVSLGSVAAAATLPISFWVLSGPFAPLAGGRFRVEPPAVWAAAIVGIVVIAKHRGNIERLIAGTERKLGEKKDDPS